MRKEAALWNRVRCGLGSYMNLRRIENAVDSGDPDVYWWSNGIHGWIELKAAQAPARRTTRVFGSAGLRPAQISRILALHKGVVPVYILAGINLAGINTALYLVEGRHAAVFNDMTLSDIGEVAVWCHEQRMTSADWQELAAELQRR